MERGRTVRRLAAAALALGVLGLAACSDDGGSDDAAADAPTGTRAPSPLGGVDLPPLVFDPVDDQGTVATDITSEALFDLDSAVLKDDAEVIVQQIAARLSATPSSVRIDGYTDGLGDPAHNQQLSSDRAQALAERVRALGTATSVYSCGRGEEGSDGTSADPTQRRVVVTISVTPMSEECP